jgi:hypothetical protein
MFYKHGHTMGGKKTKTYQAWKDMKERCFKQTHKEFHWYGGRGITVCKRWLDFNNFLKDMGHAPKNLSLDRINNNGNYTLKNCRWTDAKTQTWNTRQCKMVELNGEIMPLAVASEKLGMCRPVLSQRLIRGWPMKFITAKKGTRLKDLLVNNSASLK